MNVYRVAFGLAYAIYTLCALSFCLSFKFGLFLQELGAGDIVISLVISVAVAFGVVAKFSLPRMTVRYDLRLIWGGAHLAMVAGAALLAATNIFGFDVFLGRGLFVIGYACSTVLATSFVQSVVPRAKSTGAVTLFGGSLFMGMALSAFISDWLQGRAASEAQFHDYLFWLSALAATGAGALCFLIPKQALLVQVSSRNADWASYLRVCRHWTGLGAMLLGAAFAIPQLFLAMFVNKIGIYDFAWFFYGYTATAFGLRFVMYRFVGEQQGIPRELLVTCGFASLAAAMAAYLWVSSPVHLLVPGILTALCRTLAEPSLLTLGGERVSASSHVTGTATVSGLIDLGLITLTPLIGLLIVLSGGYSLPFWVVGVAATGIATSAGIGFVGRHRNPATQTSLEPHQNQKLVLITETVDQCVLEYLKKQPQFIVKYMPHCSRVDLKHEIKAAHVLICRVATRLDRRVLSKATCLELIVSGSAGLNHIDLEQAFAQEIRVMNCDYSSSQAVSELAIGLTLAALRHVSMAHSNMREGAWERHLFVGRELSSHRIAVWGAGQIGMQVAEKLRLLGCKVAVYDPLQNSRLQARGFHHCESLDELLADAEILFVQVPLTSQTYQQLNQAQLTKLPDGAVIVNTSRGEIVQEDDLLSALRSGKISSYATDVWSNEPHFNRRLASHPSVVGTPHLGAMTMTTQRRVGEAVIDRLASFYSVRHGRRAATVYTFPLQVILPGGERSEIEVFDYSAQGLGVQSTQHLQVNDELWVELWDRAVQATVCWVELSQAGTHRGGLVLNEPFDDAELALLAQFQEKRGSQRSLPADRAASFTDDPDQFVLLRNHSESGAMIESSRAFEVGDSVRITIGRQVSQYRVCWLNAAGGSIRTLYGLEKLVASNSEAESDKTQQLESAS